MNVSTAQNFQKITRKIRTTDSTYVARQSAKASRRNDKRAKQASRYIGFEV